MILIVCCSLIITFCFGYYSRKFQENKTQEIPKLSCNNTSKNVVLEILVLFYWYSVLIGNKDKERPIESKQKLSSKCNNTGKIKK